MSVSIFSLIIAAPTGFFIASLRGQSKALNSQELLDSVSYNMEYMSRSLRMAKKQTILMPQCLSSTGLNYEKTAMGIKFLNYKSQCQEFFLEQGRIKESKNGTEGYLTPESLQVVSFSIGPSDSWDQDDHLQSRVTLFLELQGKDQRPETKAAIKIQTTISQRNIDVTY